MNTNQQEQESKSSTGTVDQAMVAEVTERILARYAEMGDVATAIGGEVHGLRTKYGENWEAYLNEVVKQLDLPDLSRTTLLNYERRYKLSRIIANVEANASMPRSMIVSYSLHRLTESHRGDFAKLIEDGHVTTDLKASRLEEILKGYRDAAGVKDYNAIFDDDAATGDDDTSDETTGDEDTTEDPSGAENATESPQSEDQSDGTIHGATFTFTPGEGAANPEQVVIDAFVSRTIPDDLEACQAVLRLAYEALDKSEEDVEVVTPKTRPRAANKTQRATKE